MPEYLSPGVYVEEISTGSKPSEGVSTSVAGFLGPTERGPEDIRYITSWLQFQRWYGDHMGVDATYMTYAVQGFFDNGGKRCYVGRITPNDATPAEDDSKGVRIVAVGRGAWGKRIFIRVSASSQSKKGVERAKDWVRVQVLYFTSELADAKKIADPFFPDPERERKEQLRRPDLIEDFDNLALNTTAANSLITAINAGSKLIRVTLKDSTKSRIEVDLVTEKADFKGLTKQGSDGAAPLNINDYEGKLDPVLAGDTSDLLGRGWGFAAMDTVDGVSLLVAPDEDKFGENLRQRVVKSCELLKDRFAILGFERNFDVGGGKRPSFDTTYGAQYFPWIWIYDPYSRDDQLVPPMGHVAGIIARTDIEQGVFKAPANAVVIGAKDLQQPVVKGLQDVLNPVGINCIRDFRSDGRGIRLWGARTMSSDPEWKYVNVRRLFLFLEESIDEGTQWVVFEPNSPITWARVERSIKNFLMTVWRNGGLYGTKPEEAFFVRCDRTTMSEDDIENGRLICRIGVAPVRPAEFVIFRIGQKTADATA